MKSNHDMTLKPYYRCFLCPRFRNTCGGRPTRDMDLKEWSQYMRDIRDYFGLSNEYITEKAASSEATTDRVMSGNPKQDIMRSTARRYEQAEIGPVGEFTCYCDHTNENKELIEKLLAEIEALKEENARKAKIIDKLLG